MSIKNNSNLYFIFIPITDDRDINLTNLNLSYESIKEILKKLNINLIDYKKYFENHKDRSSFLPEYKKDVIVHLNKKGYQDLKVYILDKIND